MKEIKDFVKCELKVEDGELFFKSPGRMMRLAKFYTEQDAQFMADLLKILEDRLR